MRTSSGDSFVNVNRSLCFLSTDTASLQSFRTNCRAGLASAASNIEGVSVPAKIPFSIWRISFATPSQGSLVVCTMMMSS